MSGALVKPLLASLLAGAVLSLASLAVVRPGLSDPVGGEGFCGMDATAPCRVETIAGGWPVAFFVNDPQISVPTSLGPEDHLHRGSFAANVLFWAMLAGYGVLWRRRARQARTL